jgi:hypothetical protein
LLSRRAARTHPVAPRHPKYFLRPHSAGSVSPGSGRPVRREHRLRPGGSPQTLQTPPRGGRPVLHNPIAASTARTNSSRSTGSGRSSRRFPSPAPISRSHRASLASRPRSPIFLRPARHYPRLWLRTPLGVGPTGLPPASNTASPARTTEPSDFPRSSISGVRPQPSPSGPPADQADERAWDLPVLAHGDSAHVQVLRPRGVRRQLAVTLPTMWPSASGDGVGTPEMVISRLNSPACTYPCQRFAHVLADANA